MNKKAQFGDMELNPIALGAGILGGILAMVVMSPVDVGIIYKVGSFCLTTVVCYIMFDRIMGGN